MTKFPPEPLGTLEVLPSRQGRAKNKQLPKRGDMHKAYECLGCGALVPHMARRRHEKFHEDLAFAIEAGHQLQKIRRTM